MVEECVRAIADSLVAVYASRTKHPDRRLGRFHYTALYAGCMCTQDDVVRYIFSIVFDEESILHIACRMIFGKVHGREYVPVVFHFRTVGDVESHTGEYVDDFILDDAERVTCSQFYGIGRTGKVEVVATVVLTFELFFESAYLFLRFVLKFVQTHADFFFEFGGYVAEVRHQFVNGSLLAEVLDAQCFQFLGVSGFQCFYFLQKLVDFSYHIVVIIYSLLYKTVQRYNFIIVLPSIVAYYFLLTRAVL